MNLIGRLLRALLLAYLRPRVPPNEEVAISLRVMPWDLDFYLHVTNSRYHSFMDLARMTYFLRSGTWGRANARGWRPVLASSTVTFRKALNLFQSFQVRCRPIGWDDHWFYLQMLFVRKGVVVVSSINKGVMVDADGKRVPMAQAMDAFGIEEEGAGLPHFVSGWVDAEGLHLDHLKSEVY